MKPKRVVSLLVAGCMAVSMVPASAVTAFAETVGNSLPWLCWHKMQQQAALAVQKIRRKVFLGKWNKTIRLRRILHIH